MLHNEDDEDIFIIGSVCEGTEGCISFTDALDTAFASLESNAFVFNVVFYDTPLSQSALLLQLSKSTQKQR